MEEAYDAFMDEFNLVEEDDFDDGPTRRKRRRRGFNSASTKELDSNNCSSSDTEESDLDYESPWEGFDDDSDAYKPPSR